MLSLLFSFWRLTSREKKRFSLRSISLPSSDDRFIYTKRVYRVFHRNAVARAPGKKRALWECIHGAGERALFVYEERDEIRATIPC